MFQYNEPSLIIEVKINLTSSPEKIPALKFLSLIDECLKKLLEADNWIQS